MRFLFVSGLVAAVASWPRAGIGEEWPLWEIGVGVAGLSIPDYRGSDERTNYLLPMPYLIYRGKNVRVDREGVHGYLFRSDRVKLELSLGAGPPTKSDENRARAGMPDIDPTVEIGGSLKIALATNARSDRMWSIGLPLRAVAATDLSHFRPIGWIFSPHLTFEAQNTGPAGGWNLALSVGPLYAAEKYHDYYYEVPREFATPERPAFDASGGYSGARVTVVVTKRFPRFWVGAFARYDNLSGAAFEQSPLIRRHDSFMTGIGIAWILARSETSVVRPASRRDGVVRLWDEPYASTAF